MNGVRSPLSKQFIIRMRINHSLRSCLRTFYRDDTPPRERVSRVQVRRPCLFALQLTRLFVDNSSLIANEISKGISEVHGEFEVLIGFGTVIPA
jgi:hypothetical protein